MAVNDWEWKMQSEISRVLEPFNFYGLDVHIPPATKAIMDIARRYAIYLVEEQKKSDNSLDT